MRKDKKNLVWLDLEMTGLDVSTDVILEIATIVTDSQLEVIEYGPDLVIHHDEQVLNRMNAWCQVYHGKSGLTQAVRESTVTIGQAEQETLEFLQKYFSVGQPIACGNSVWNDKVFLQKGMPVLYSFFDYRVVDVTSFKEVLRRWYPKSPYLDFKKKEAHRAMDDIKESIAELKHYQTHFFLPTEFTLPHKE